MRKSKELPVVLVSLIVIFSLYLAFYSRIECRPNHVGFWLTLALGISFGVALTRIIQWSGEKNKK